MCGIVGAVAQRDVVDILVEGLRRLEYRGYDSAGVAVVNGSGELQRLRRLGKVKELSDAVKATPTPGGTGIAHTRWQHTVNRASAMHIHMYQMKLLLCTTALLKITRPCAFNCKVKVMFLPRIPTRKLSLTWCKKN